MCLRCAAMMRLSLVLPNAAAATLAQRLCAVRASFAVTLAGEELRITLNTDREDVVELLKRAGVVADTGG